MTPLECKFCHHDRAGMGQQCHLEIENDWKKSEGKLLVKEWGNLVGLWDRLRKVRDELI